MSEVLYRKYRPQKFGEVIDQETIKTILQNALKARSVAHAYLFAGPRGVGKTTIARILAKAVNCEKLKQGEPCTVCENCQAVAAGRFLDLVEIDAATHTQVEKVREVIEHVKFTPSRGKYKVFIIDEVHMLSKAAFNALLKTLEEPPAHAIFILATTEVYKVPATIISRSQRFDFKPVSEADILKLFERILPELKVKVEKQAQTLIAQAAAGSFRDALSILDQVIAFGGAKVTLDVVEDILGVTRIEVYEKLLDLIIQNQSGEAAKLVRQLSSAGKDLVQFTRGFLEYLRQVLLTKMGAAEGPLQAAARQSAELTGTQLLTIIKKIMEAHRESKTSPVSELPLLSAVLELTGPESRNTESQNTKSRNLEISDQSERPTVRKPDSSSALNLGRVVDQWSEVLSRVKEYNHALIGSLRLGRLVRLEGEQLILAFPYSFHKETIEARKNRIVVEQVLEDVFGLKLKLKSLLEREVGKEEAEANPDLLGEAMKILGANDR